MSEVHLPRPRTTAPPDGAGAPRFADALAAEVAKLRTLRTTWLAPAVACLATTLLGVLSGPADLRIALPEGTVPLGQVPMAVLAPAYLVAAVAVVAAGGEHPGGQLLVSLLAVPDRRRLVAAKLTATTLAILAAAAVAVLPGQLLVHLGGPAGAAPAIVRTTGTLLVVYLLLACIGHGLATLTRSTTVAMILLVGTPVLLAPLLTDVVPDVVGLLPHEADTGLLDIGPGSHLDPPAALATLAVWAVGSVALGASRTLRSDGPPAAGATT